jgi:tetratricopeptide (TPR) repeat protein
MIRSPFIPPALVIIFACGAISSTMSASDSWEVARRNGGSASELGNYQDARRFLEASLAALDKQPPGGDKDLQHAELDDELGNICQILGDMTEAERLYSDAENILRTHAEIAPGVRAIIWGDIGLFRARQGRLAEAAAMLETSLASSRGVLQEGDIGTAELACGLGQVYTVQGKVGEGERLLLESLDTFQKRLPFGHMDRIVTKSSLGTLYMTQGRYPEAEHAMQEAVNEARQRGESQPVYAALLASLADLYRLERNPARGEPLLKKARSIYEAAFGPDSPRAAEVLLDISIDNTSAKKYAVAEKDVSKALDILRRKLGPEHPTVALAEFRLANVYAGQGRYREAAPLLTHAIAVQERTWPDGHFLLADSLFQLAEVAKEDGRYGEAEVHYQRAIAVYEKAGRAGAGGLAAALRGYANLLRHGRKEELKAVEKRAQEAQRSLQAFR